jgi:hypothetical protein
VTAVGAGSESGGGVLRFTAAGAVDVTFGDHGYAQLSWDIAAAPEAIAVDAYGRIVVAGSQTDPDNADRRIAFVRRYWP